MLFKQRQTTNMFQAALTTLALIYHQSVYNLRTSHRNAVMGLLLTMLQSVVMVAFLMTLFLLLGMRSSPIRGDFLLYIMSGIFIFMTHVSAVGAVAGSASVSTGILKHNPLNAAVLISAAALTSLYRQTLACITILGFYYLAFTPFSFEYPVAVAGMFMMAWFSGVCVGLIFLGIRPWSPEFARMATMLYQRVNMFASGKLFVANAMPGFLLPWFEWNPLFHLIDQTRGFIFINYTPMHTKLFYPLWVAIACMMVGLLINFTTRKYESLSWSAGQ